MLLILVPTGLPTAFDGALHNVVFIIADGLLITLVVEMFNMFIEWNATGPTL